jgi:hypothetical protein
VFCGSFYRGLCTQSMHCRKRGCFNNGELKGIMKALEQPVCPPRFEPSIYGVIFNTFTAMPVCLGRSRQTDILSVARSW